MLKVFSKLWVYFSDQIIAIICAYFVLIVGDGIDELLGIINLNPGWILNIFHLFIGAATLGLVFLIWSIYRSIWENLSVQSSSIKIIVKRMFALAAIIIGFHAYRNLPLPDFDAYAAEHKAAELIIDGIPLFALPLFYYGIFIFLLNIVRWIIKGTSTKNS